MDNLLISTKNPRSIQKCWKIKQTQHKVPKMFKFSSVLFSRHQLVNVLCIHQHTQTRTVFYAKKSFNLHFLWNLSRKSLGVYHRNFCFSTEFLKIFFWIFPLKFYVFWENFTRWLLFFTTYFLSLFVFSRFRLSRLKLMCVFCCCCFGWWRCVC